MTRSPPRRQAAAPDRVDPKAYSICLLGPLALGLSVGIQITMTAFLLLGPAGQQESARQLTEHGKVIARPERDLLIFVAGAALTMAAALMNVWYWRARLARIETHKVSETMQASALLQGVLGVSSLLVSLLLACSCWFSRDFLTAESATRPLPDLLAGLRMLLPAAVALLCAITHLECGESGAPAADDHSEVWRRRISRILLYAVPLSILLVVGVPPSSWRFLAGRFFAQDAYHHLNFFMMGPALAFAHGKAFGTEIYSQYGIGWPLLGSLLSRLSALTYANLIGLEIVYSCLYCIALFFLLRHCLQSELWAAFAVVLAIYWELFSGMNAGDQIWLTPSSTMLRHPMDVWFFLALVMHQRSDRTLWAVLAGAVTAFAVFFETETGAYLLVTFLIYSVLRAGLAPGQRHPVNVKDGLLPPLLFCTTATVALLPMLLYASRGTLFTRAFWRGWIEALVAYAGQGVGALPLAELPDVPFAAFIFMGTVYLAVVSYAVVRGWHQSASEGAILLATVAAYGLALLLLFVNRSHPYNLCHAAIPFAVVLTALVVQGYALWKRRLPHCTPLWALGGLILLLLTKPEFLRYPSCLRSVFVKTPASGSPPGSNLPDASGLPPAAQTFVQEAQGICQTIRSLAPDGKDVAILDRDDTVLYSEANACPWSRYASLFHMALTQSAVADMRADLIRRPPKYVVTRGQNSPRFRTWDFVWAPLYEVVTNRYVLYQTVGSYEVWRPPTSHDAGH